MQGMVVLADQHGTLIHTMGHVDFLARQADQLSLWRVLAGRPLGPNAIKYATQKRVGGDSRRRF
jgi:hypothetical protein